MQCPRCAFVGEASYGQCPRCGHVFERYTATFSRPLVSQPSMVMAALPTLMRGDVVRERYRLVEPVSLPKNQQGQGIAWAAFDMQMQRRRVLLRRIQIPRTQDPQRVIETIITHFKWLAQHPGIPPILDTFSEQGFHYIVQQAPVGEALAMLIQRQGGALPEQDIAEYGKQLCEMLVLLSQHMPPLVHGAINPETIIVSPGARQVSLILMPLLPPSPLPKDNPASGYLAPEQTRGEILPSSDLYSVAATLHHAVTGYDPRERLTHFYPPARRLNPLVTPGLETILAQQLRLLVKQRYAHPNDMLADLNALIESYPTAPMTPLSTQASLNGIDHEGERPRAASRRTPWILVTLSVTLIVALLAGFFAFSNFSSHNAASNFANATATTQAQQAAFQQELALETQSFQKKGIGVSDGRLVFDTYPGRSDVNLKQQAAQAMQQGDMSTAVNLLNQAVTADPIDGEAEIYNENLHILQDNAPYVTIVIGLPIDGSDVYLGSDRMQLEAVYLAQHETNTGNLLPGGRKLRILIANSGTSNDNVATVAQFIANRVAKDGNPDHILAVVGWPYSTQTINARDILAGVHIPLVSQTSSSVKLSGSSPYFFRVCPADDLQGAALGSLLMNKLAAKKILVLRDPTDLYSVSLAGAVASRTLALGANITQATFTEKTTTVAQYQQMVENAVRNNIDTIFIAGYNVDGIRLAHAVGNEARANPNSPLLSTLRVVGADNMASGVLIGEGNNADAATARAFPQDMRRLIFTSYADANEWNLLKIPRQQQPAFFSDWTATYQGSAMGPNAPDPTYESMLIYDAVGVITRAISLSHDPLNGDAVRSALTSLGKGKIPAYQGVSGRIVFDDKGNPIDKAVVVLTIQDNGKGNEIVVQQVIGTFR